MNGSLAIQPLTGKARVSVQRAVNRLNIWDGAVRSGKTISSLGAWLKFIQAGPQGNLLMAGKSERTLKRNVLDPLTEMIGDNCRQVTGAGEAWIYGRRVYLAGAHDERSVQKIQGMTLAGAYGDEISTWPESFYSMLLTRLSVEGARFFGTTNPDGPNHWLKINFLDRSGITLNADGSITAGQDDALDLARFCFILDDNPHLGQNYVDSIKKEFSGLWRERYINGRWAMAEGVIYDMWDAGRHVVSELPDINEYFMGIDYGTKNPFAALLFGVGTDDKLYIVKEFYWDSKKEHRQLTDSQYSQKLKEWLGSIIPERIYCDPSAASFLQQLYYDGWHGVTPADNAVQDGIREVSSLLSTDLLFVHESCDGLREEIPGYVWDDKAAGKGEDRPLKVNDHAVDALRYGVRNMKRIWRYWLPSCQR